MADEIVKYDPKLAEMAGWERLKQEPGKMERVQEIDRSIVKHATMAAAGTIGLAVDLDRMQEELKAERLLRAYVETRFEKSADAAWTILRWIKKLKKGGYTTDQFAKVGESMMRLKAPTGYTLGEVVNTLLKFDPPRNSLPKTIDGLVEGKLLPTLTEGRSSRGKRKVIKLTDDSMMPLAYNALRLIMERNPDLTTVEKRHVLKTVGGWTMQQLAIPGEIKLRPMSIPDSVQPNPVGFPRGKKRNTK